MVSSKKSYFSIFAVVITTAVLLVCVWFLLTKTIDRVIQKEAGSTAVHWMSFLVANIDDMDAIVKDGEPNQSQLKAIKIAIEDGEVFGFHIFRPDGTTSFSSDNYQLGQPGSNTGVVNEKALAVYQSGNSNIATHDGSQKSQRPDVYVEAYIPVFNKAGALIGVSEVYVDQTEISLMLKDGFRWIVLFLPVLSALMFLFPALKLLKASATTQEAKAKAEHLANFDSLTGVFNRRSFNDAAEEYFQEHESVGVFFIDIDDFKRINDEYGHDGGDAFLRNVAHTLKSLFGEDAIFARFGGDEFVACIGGISLEELQLLAQDVLASISQGMSHRGHKIIGHVSIGLHVANSNTAIGDMLNAADIALYKSKNGGKNMVTVFSDDLNDEFKRQQKLEKLLNSAVDGTGLELFFQSINKPETEKTIGFEALLRLRDEEGEMIYPDEFIPIAERFGLINDIGKWVLINAIKSAKDWPEDIFISVNLSAVQFEKGDLPSFISNLLREERFPAERLEVEVTESLLIGDDGSTQKQLLAIKKLGVSIAMDDFGTGYSSLAYLWKYEFDKLKIDRSFLLGYDQNPTKLGKVISAVIDLGHGIDMSVTMEGVESNKHANILNNMGCDQLQGYYFGKPMNVASAKHMMKA